MDTNNPKNTPGWSQTYTAADFQSDTADSATPVLNEEGLTPTMATAASAARGIPTIAVTTTRTASNNGHVSVDKIMKAGL